MYIGHRDDKTNTENWYLRNGRVAVTKPDCAVLKPLELVGRKNLEEFGEAMDAISRD
jgi:hypothetical protein